jgi:hypothetical protein
MALISTQPLSGIFVGIKGGWRDKADNLTAVS